jgi:hypothetical protein
MPRQDGFGDNGPKATGLSKPDDGDDGMQKKSKNVGWHRTEEAQEFRTLAEFAHHTLAKQQSVENLLGEADPDVPP